ncbi:MCE family protein [Nocardia seriolae]|uniref:MCE family protein n=1 Tax=Nocardia seriolae TaxID=37332 RepID=UPI0008FF68F5|nr:MCE family protein [Nocardia seriolae]OJF80348.1 mammalian cell entry protein [Nocardia seriolae]QOW35701.1 MCE family protein [Nocardia seriolae]QUN16808.1 MCE family protein [Nocardia seriolae]WNJ56091.1 MCE family protein [Nocardia seriolae]
MNPPLWQWVVRHRIAIANLGLIAVLVLGSGYVGGYVLRFNPIPHTYAVTVELPSSGGLLPGNDVTFRGSRIGKVTDVHVAGDGVAAVTEIEDSARIPVGGTVAVGRLSAAGEQYLDFRPDSDTGPYLRDGALVERAHTSIPVQIQSVFANLGDLIGGMNLDRLNVIIDELDRALAGGPDRLRNVISGISRAMSGLDGLLPQTRQLIENLEVIANTTQHAQPDLGTLTKAGSVLFDQFASADQELRKLLRQGPGQLATLNGFITETQDPITNLVTNFVAVTKAAKLRAPAIAALFPALRAGSEALGVPAHHGAYNTLVDPWPRPSCDYETIPVVPTDVQADNRVRLYNYCVTANPALQVRGSANAPRPDVPDNGTTAPPGATGNEMSQPIPR